MKPDMAKVIVERPRSGSRAPNALPRGRVPRDPDLMPARQGMGGRWRRRRKWLNENLAPLRRYLDAQVGRPWDKVYAEICSYLRPTSTVQQHVRDHLEDFVALRTWRVDGAVWAADRHGRPFPIAARSWLRLYVDPQSGLLRRNKGHRGAPRRRAAHAAVIEAMRAQRMRVLDAWTQLHLLDDGGWWEVRLAATPGETRRDREREPIAWLARAKTEPDDVVLRAGLSRMDRWELYGSTGLHAVAKRQLSRAEIKRLGLR